MNRRNFLKSTAIAAVVCAISTIGLAKPAIVIPNVVFVDFGEDILPKIRSREYKYLGTAEFWSLGKYRSIWMQETYQEFVDTNPHALVVLKITDDYIANGAFTTFVRKPLLEIAKHVVIESEGKMLWWKNRTGVELPDVSHMQWFTQESYT